MLRPHCCLMTMDNSLPHYQWLASNDGATVLSTAAAMRADGLSDLKIGESLRTHLDSERAAMVLTQLDLRERARAKFTRASDMLFTRPGLEQATSEAIARYRSGRFSGYGHIVDLCCGIGGDLIALAETGADVTAVDRDPVHLFLAEHNVRVYHPDAKITQLLMNVEDAPITGAEAVFIDPARREGSGRRTGYQSEPSVEWSVALAEHVGAVGIKTAPGIPHTFLPEDWEMELIALGSELKEAVLWSPGIAGEFSRYQGSYPYRATVITEGVVHSIHGQHIDVLTTVTPEVGQWLHDVNPAVTNAGLVRELAVEMDAHLIDPEIGFLVSDYPSSTPLATSWKILDVLPWHEKQIKRSLANLGIGPIDIRRRGLPGDVPSITKRLRGKGDRRAIIAMTRTDNIPTAIICSLE